MELNSPQLLHYQDYMLEEIGLERDQPTVVQAVTGAGKTMVFAHLVHRWAQMKRKCHIYIHRKIVFEQLDRVLSKLGVPHGLIASGYSTTPSAIQLCMSPTVKGKVKKGIGTGHADLVVIDEAHVNASGKTLELLQAYEERGSYIVGFTATPIGLGHFYQRMIIGCDTKTARDAGMILEAECYNVTEPDMHFVRKVKRPVGEAEQELHEPHRYLYQIVGRVYDHWCQVNPDRLPTILFAPGKPEAKWFCQQFVERGVKAAHIDGEKIWMNGRYHSSDKARKEFTELLIAGEEEVVTNRFVLREGLDVTNFYCALLCTRFGSESSYLQAVGRVLRAHPGYGHVVIADHGGNFRIHGSPNAVRHWDLADTNETRAYERHERIRQGQDEEMITCPQCQRPRRTGVQCPFCGYVSAGLNKPVLQTNGRLVRSQEATWKPKRRAAGDLAKKEWASVLWSHRKRGLSYRQALASFRYRMQERHRHFNVWPDPSWDGYPKYIVDLKMPVGSLPNSRLQGGVFVEPSEPRKRRRKKTERQGNLF